MVAAQTLERIGYTLVLFASIVFATILAFVVLAALTRIEPNYSIANVIDSLTPILVISTAALTIGTVAVITAKVRDSGAGR